MSGWIGIDLDGTLAVYTGWKGATDIGEPIAPMVEAVKEHMKMGREIRIFTARVSHDGSLARRKDAIEAEIAIDSWCRKVFGTTFKVTNVKDYGMVALYDDRCIQVHTNTGIILGDERSVLGERQRTTP